MKKTIYLGLIILLIISFSSVAIKQTAYSDIYTDGKTKTAVIYSAPRIYEDKTWKPIEEAKTLLNSPDYHVIIKSDDKTDLKINVVNYTDGKLAYYFEPIIIDDKLLNTEIPIKIESSNASKTISTVSYITPKTTDKNSQIMIQVDNTKDIIHIGEESTTITLDYNDLTDDVYVANEGSTEQYVTFIKWSLADLTTAGVSQSNLISAKLNMRINDFVYDVTPPTNTYNVSYITSQTWSEASAVSVFNAFTYQYSHTGTYEGTWSAGNRVNATVTTELNRSFINGNSNFTVFVRNPNLAWGNVGDTVYNGATNMVGGITTNAIYVEFDSDEAVTTGNRPQLIVEYQEAIVDSTYPSFSDFKNNSIIHSGTAKFNVTVLNTNGTVFLSINNQNYTASNVSNKYNVSVDLSFGTYPYYWGGYGNGTSHNYNESVTFEYSVQRSVDTYFVRFIDVLFGWFLPEKICFPMRYSTYCFDSITNTTYWETTIT